VPSRGRPPNRSLPQAVAPQIIDYTASAVALQQQLCVCELLVRRRSRVRESAGEENASQTRLDGSLRALRRQRVLRAEVVVVPSNRVQRAVRVSETVEKPVSTTPRRQLETGTRGRAPIRRAAREGVVPAVLCHPLCERARGAREDVGTRAAPGRGGAPSWSSSAWMPPRQPAPGRPSPGRGAPAIGVGAELFNHAAPCRTRVLAITLRVSSAYVSSAGFSPIPKMADACRGSDKRLASSLLSAATRRSR